MATVPDKGLRNYELHVSSFKVSLVGSLQMWKDNFHKKIIEHFSIYFHIFFKYRWMHILGGLALGNTAVQFCEILPLLLYTSNIRRDLGQFWEVICSSKSRFKLFTATKLKYKNIFSSSSTLSTTEICQKIPCWDACISENRKLN